MSNNQHATPAQAIERGHYTVLSTMAPQGNWWHTVLYRHIWQESGGPNSLMVHIVTAIGDEPTTALVDSLLESAAAKVAAAIEGGTLA